MKGVNMATVDNLGHKLINVTRAAVKASSEFLEVTKINLAIKSEEDKIKAIMFDIGKGIYDSYIGGKPVEDQLALKCDDISLLESNIEVMRQKILEIKNAVRCEGCSAEIDNNVLFCPKCGIKIS